MAHPKAPDRVLFVVLLPELVCFYTIVTAGILNYCGGWVIIFISLRNTKYEDEQEIKMRKSNREMGKNEQKHRKT